MITRKTTNQKMMYMTDSDRTIPRTRPVTQAQRKKMFIQLYEKNHYKVSECCRQMRLSRMIFYAWMRKDPDFKEQIDILDAQLIENTAQSYYDKYVDPKSSHSTRVGQEFWLTTKGKEHGFSTKTETEHTGQLTLPPVQINFVVVNKEVTSNTREAECQILNSLKKQLPMSSEDLK